ncbi:MAG: GLUG motif-containing protein [Planctomycetota bacterium]
MFRKQWLVPTVAALLVAAAQAQTITITTEADLINVANNLSADYELAGNITLSGNPWTPLGNSNTPFTGTFDGHNFTISNLNTTLTPNNATGLFGVVNGGSLSNVRLSQVNVMGWENVGALAGHVMQGSVSSCYVQTGSVTGVTAVGGLIGRTMGTTVQSCRTDLTVNGWSRWAGGLVGHCHYGTTISTCGAGGLVAGFEGVGGLLGNLHGSVCTGSIAKGNVTGLRVVGGLIGWMQEDREGNQLCIEAGNSAHGNVTSTGTGLVMFFDGSNNQFLATASAGGLVGWVDHGGFLMNSMATGDVEGTTGPAGTSSGGLVGATEGNVSISYCNAYGDVLNGSNSGGLVGWLRDDSTLVSCSAVSHVKGDFQVGGLVGAFQRASATDCTAEGTVTATGIANVFGSQPGAAAGGLVGYTWPDTTQNYASTLSRCRAQVDVNANGQYAGGLAGLSWGLLVDRCWHKGLVESNDQRLGGLIGGTIFNSGDGAFQATRVVNSYSVGTVDQSGAGASNGLAAGLVGEIQTSGSCLSSLENCYTATNIIGSGLLGGLVAQAGSQATAVSCYWNSDIAGTPNSALGLARTTAQMHQQATYVNWVFNGWIWWITNGVTYPELF